MTELTELAVLIDRAIEAGKRLCFDNSINCDPALLDLWNETCSFRTLFKNDNRSLPNLYYIEHRDDAVCVGLIRSAYATFLDIERDIKTFDLQWHQNPGKKQSPDKQRCKWYGERLRLDRVALACALDRLENDRVKRMAICMQRSEVLDFCYEVNNGRNKNAHIACLDGFDHNSLREQGGQEFKRDTLDLNPLSLYKLPLWNHWAHFGRLLRGRCLQTCLCRCHALNPHACPKTFRQVFRRLFPRASSSLFLVNQCTKISCRNNEGHRGQLTIVVHSAFVKKAILICAIGRGLKFKFHIKEYPIVSRISDGAKCAEKGDLEGIKKLFRTGRASVRDMTPDGWLHLHEASFHGHTELVNFLLKEGADPDMAELKLRKPSHLAKFRALTVRASDAEKALARLFPNEQDFRADLELSPILTAILREYDTADKEKPSLKDLIAFAREVMKSFPDKKWEAWTSEYKNRSPLFTEVIQFLRKSTARGKSLSTAFLELLEQPDALQGWKPLQWAAFVGRVDDFKLVLLNGADAFAITASGRSLIHQAAATGSVEVLEYIFANDFQNRGLDINARDIWGDTPLHIVAELSAAAIEILMKYRADLEARSPQGQVPLHYTRYLKGQKRVEAVRAFLKHGNSQANALDENGRSPMFYFLDSPQSVSLLLDHHADVSVCDSEGKTIIHHICGERRPYLLRMMLKRCPLEVLAIKDNAGDTPLFSAFRNHSEECVKLLLNRAPFSSLEDKDGWTLVHHAVKMGDVSVLEYVLTVPGISLYAKNKLGQDAFAIAREMGTMNQRIGEILAKAASVC